MMHPDTRITFISPEIGYGVCAVRMIPQGTIVWAQDPLDIVLQKEALPNLPDLVRRSVEHYAFVHSSGNFILCWDAGRYINHSCEPSTVSVGNFCTIAAYDIQPGEQLTEDYATLNLISPLDCLCGSPQCRSKVNTHDLKLLSQRLDDKADEAIRGFLSVDQVLLSLLSLEHQTALYESATGQRPLPTCFDNAPNFAQTAHMQ